MQSLLLELDRLAIAESRARCEASLAQFVREAWGSIEPGPLVWGWHMDAICQHLEAISRGDITRLIINVPPGHSKSLLLNVFLGAWEWTGQPGLRYVCTAHNQALAIRDATKMRRLVLSDWYRARWPHVELAGDQNSKTKFETTAAGFREAVALSSLTGVRGDRVLLDDPDSAESANSEAERETTKRILLESVPTRLNDPAKSAIVLIQQRLHMEDCTGVLLERNLGYEHLMLPCEFDPARRSTTSIGFSDPRQEEGELLFPERFPREVVERDKRIMGKYATAGQFQQLPIPRGGAILDRDLWQVWDDQAAAEHGVAPGDFPPMDVVVASLDTAMSERTEADYSALTVWGVWTPPAETSFPRLMLMHAFKKRLNLHGNVRDIERRDGETLSAWKMRTGESWGLVEHVVHACQRFHVDILLVEDTAAGKPLAQELRRLYRHAGFGVRMVTPKGDKVARAWSVQSIFAEGVVYAPDRRFADMVIDEAAIFPRGANDDLVDSLTQALKWLRDTGILYRREDAAVELDMRTRDYKRRPPVYEV